MRLSTEERLVRRLEESESGCWLWTGGVNSSGYGVIQIDGRTSYVHRVSYQLFIGEIPKGLQIDHLCRVRTCANPMHLEPVTLRENVLRGEGAPAKNARRTHCIKGHEFSGDNLYLEGTRRRCRICCAERSRIYEASGKRVRR